MRNLKEFFGDEYDKVVGQTKNIQFLGSNISEYKGENDLFFILGFLLEQREGEKKFYEKQINVLIKTGK